MLQKSSQFFVIRAALWPKSLDVALNIAGVEKNTVEKHAVAVNTEGHSIRVLNDRTVVTVEICVLCGL